VTYVSRHVDENGSIRRPEDGLGRTDSTESRHPVAMEAYDSSAVDTTESLVEINGDGEEALQESPVQDDRGRGGAVFFRATSLTADIWCVSMDTWPGRSHRLRCDYRDSHPTAR
jgi:hypothetical protein